MSDYLIPQTAKSPKLKKHQVQLVANGDLRQSANQKCWPEQAKMEEQLGAMLGEFGYEVVRAHPYKELEGHGFIASQKEGMQVFAGVDPSAPLIVVEAVWQYSHHLLHGLYSHQGPILTVANWSGEWPGLVGMLNLNGSLTKAGVRYDTLWSQDFTDAFFLDGLKRWLDGQPVGHDTSHAHPLKDFRLPEQAESAAREVAETLRHDKAILGIFDEGCMGMYNAIIDDELLNPGGV